MKKRWVINVLIAYIVQSNLAFSNLRRESINKKSLKNQVVYLIDEDLPFTGELMGEGIKEEYENGIKNGFFQGFVQDKNEKFMYEGKYINGIKHGAWTLKYLTGDTKGILKYNYDKPNGQWTYFYDNKNIEGYENLEDGILHGKVVKYSLIGEVMTKVEYFNGLLEGEVTFFYKGKVLETLASFKFGKMDGGIKIFGVDGVQILEGSYKSNRRDGVWKFFYKTGDIKAVVNYKDGLKNGETTIYDKAGVIAQKTRYMQGKEMNSDGSILGEDKKMKDSIVDRFKKFNRNLKYENYDKILSEME